MEYWVPGGETSGGLVMLAIMPLVALLYYMIGKGKNWARIAFSILCILSTISGVTELLSHSQASEWLGMSRLGFDLAGMSVELPALVLLFHPVSSAWFSAVSGPMTNPLNTTLRIITTNPLNTVLGILRNTDRPVLSYVWRAWLIDLAPGILILVICIGAIAASGFELPSSERPSLSFGWSAILVAPWLETLLMWPILSILKRVIPRQVLVAVVSAVIWGIGHGLEEPLRGVTATWSFFVLSLCFLEWEKKSIWEAFEVTALLHFSINLGPSLLLLAGQWGTH